MAAYTLSIQIESQRTPASTNEMAALYLHEPISLVRHVLKSTDNDTSENVRLLTKALRKYLMKLSDFVQAKTLEDLGKGQYSAASYSEMHLQFNLVLMYVSTLRVKTS